jgi:RNA polymerase sigma-70 factor (ECF subfamily)
MADSRPAVAEQPTERARAFLRLVDDHLDAAYRLARAILHDATDAQDATHDAFEQAWRKWSTLRDPARFEPWFDRILVNTCRDRRRSAPKCRRANRIDRDGRCSLDRPKCTPDRVCLARRPGRTNHRGRRAVDRVPMGTSWRRRHLPRAA